MVIKGTLYCANIAWSICLDIPDKIFVLKKYNNKILIETYAMYVKAWATCAMQFHPSVRCSNTIKFES